MQLNKHDKSRLTEYLKQFVSEKRKKRFEEVLSERTAHIRLLLEDIYQGHNAAAVLRSCDCFGIQHIHFMQDRNQVKISEEIAMGSTSWLSVHKHNGAEESVIDVIRNLKKEGYRIVATTPHENDQEISKLPVDKKMVLVFGTEIDGISNAVLEEADEFVKIPMYGFTESFNISVSAALCLYELSGRMRREVKGYHLSEEEKEELYLDWTIKSIETGLLLVERWKKENVNV